MYYFTYFFLLFQKPNKTQKPTGLGFFKKKRFLTLPLCMMSLQFMEYELRLKFQIILQSKPELKAKLNLKFSDIRHLSVTYMGKQI